MKNFTPILTIFLTVAVAVLFYLQFSTKKNSTISSKNLNDSVAAASGFKIAYFEMDSLENQYNYLKDVRSNLRSLEQKKSGELAALRNSGRNKIAEYQKRGHSMTEQEMAAANEDIMRLDNELKSQEQQKSQELQDESIRKIQDVKNTIEAFLKEYNKGKNFSYILSSSADIMYLKDTAYNITKDLIEGLNNEYKKKKKP